MNAMELIKYGITLAAFTAAGDNKQKIRFDRYSSTLYLPQLTVTDIFTEVMLRNLLAFEFIDPKAVKVMAQHLELMSSLIHSTKDVKILRKCGVIVPGSIMVSEDYIAAM
ncbi:hypothetical protein SUGI_0026700 [Cryptomeria japonica]|nr:hypothetical protein SUGI_0026700 [Cryptomeria japonica]